MKTKNIVIIGGGISGLFLAWKLAKNGHKVTVIEKSSLVGGIASSITENGFVMDIGPHYIFLPKNSKAANDIKFLLGDENIVNVNTKHKIFFDGLLLDNNPTLYDFLFKMGNANFLKAFLSFLKTRFVSSHTPLTPKSFLTRKYGSFLTEKFFEPYVFGKCGTLDITLDEMKDILPEVSPKSFFSFFRKRSTQIKIQQENTNTENNPFVKWYPKKGMIQLIESLMKNIEKENGSVVSSCNINEINHNDKVILCSNNNKSMRIPFELIIYATPLNVTLKLLSNFPDEFNSITSEPKKNLILVYLFIKSYEHQLPWAISSSEPKIIFSRISNQSMLSKEVCPKGFSLFCVEIPVDKNEKLWLSNDIEIIEYVKKDLDRTRLLKSELIEGTKIIRFPNILPKGNQFDKNKQKIIDYINNLLENEFTLGSIEDDRGRAASDKIKEKGPKTTGVLTAINNAEKLISMLEKHIE